MADSSITEVFDNLGIAVIITSNQRITQTNKVAERLSGKSAQQMLGKPFDQIFTILNATNRFPIDFSEQTDQKRQAIIVSCKGEEQEIELSFTISHEDNSENLTVVCVPSPGNELNFDKQRHLRQLNIVGQLTGGVAHDLNNMLGGIIGCAELLSEQVTENDRNRELINTIYESSQSAADLNSKLLSFSRKEEKRKESYDAHAAIEDTLDLLRRSIDKRIEIEISFNSRAHYINGCPVDIKSSILNIGVNARDAMPQGGTFRVATSDCWLDKDKNPNPNFNIESGHFIKIDFSDTGSGIPKSIIDKIFNPYFTTKASGEGTGLGLSTVAQTVSEYGGTVAIESAVGIGTALSLYLPVTEEICSKDSSKPTDGEPGKYPSRRITEQRGKLVLLADDEDLMRAALSEMLKSLGYRIITATNGEEAVKLFLEHGENIDLVILDLVMPKMDGADAFTAIKALHPEVRTIIASGYTQNRSFDDLREKGVLAFLRKPFTMTQLSNAITQAMADPDEGQQEPAKREQTAVIKANKNTNSRFSNMPVLLVEDDDVLREVITSVLENRGYSVMAMSNGSDASLLLKCGEQYPICIFDLNLPGTSGFELCQLAKKHRKGTPNYIIVITSEREHAVHHKILNSGGDDFISKPFTLDLLSVRLDVAENILANSKRRIAAEEALRASEEKMALAINNAELGLWELDISKREMSVSPMWRQLTGCPDNFPGGPLQYLQDVTTPDTYNNIRNRLSSFTIDEQEVFSIESKIRHHHKGNIWLLMVGKATNYDSDGKATKFSGFCQDITIRKLVELSQERQRKMLEEMVMERTEELVRINQELTQEMEAREKAEQDNLRQQRKLMDTEKLASLGTLVSGVGHEINNPTQFIMLNMPFIKGVWESALPVLDEHYTTNPDFKLRGVPYALAREKVPVMSNDILEGAERINHIVRELKDYARQGTSEMFEEFDLNRIVESVQTLLGHFIKEHTDYFILDIPEKELIVEANATRIEQVIINLIQNSCLALDSRQKSVTLALSEDIERGGINITVRDEGHGIEEQHLRHLTDPFFTTRQSSGGTGLGLSICDRIVHNHKGELTIDSTPGQGTTVSIFLPRYQEQKQEAENAE